MKVAVHFNDGGSMEFEAVRDIITEGVIVFTLEEATYERCGNKQVGNDRTLCVPLGSIKYMETVK